MQSGESTVEVQNQSKSWDMHTGTVLQLLSLSCSCCHVRLRENEWLPMQSTQAGWLAFAPSQDRPAHKETECVPFPAQRSHRATSLSLSPLNSAEQQAADTADPTSTFCIALGSMTRAAQLRVPDFGLLPPGAREESAVWLEDLMLTRRAGCEAWPPRESVRLSARIFHMLHALNQAWSSVESSSTGPTVSLCYKNCVVTE